MNDYLRILKSIAPEMTSLVRSRYEMLNVIDENQPIGRRALSIKLGSTERIVRKEAGSLKDIGLIDFTVDGMVLTEHGESVFKSLRTFLGDFEGIRSLEESLEKQLGIKKAIIAEIPRTIETAEDRRRALSSVGKLASEYLKLIIKDRSVIGLAGGSSVYSVIDNFKSQKNEFKDVTVIPARGGIGIKAEYQANTLVEKLADKLGCKYHVLYTPDILSRETIDKLREEPQVKEIIEKINEIDILIFGVGQALQMAERRSLTNEEKSLIEGKGAVSEAFGYYFDENSNIVHEISTIGVELEHFKRLENLIAVASGEEKAEAIESISKLNHNLVLITDENVARAILQKRRK